MNRQEVNSRRGNGYDTGDYIARVPATTAEGVAGEKIVRGLPQGIRFFEYCSKEETLKTQLQLAYLAWKTEDIGKVTSFSMPKSLKEALERYNLNDDERLESIHALKDGVTCCPLCLEPVSAKQLMERVPQAEGREVMDLTITEANLFHIEALRPGEFNHRIYKVCWGHHNCNTAARDKGVKATLDWMEKILRNNGRI